MTAIQLDRVSVSFPIYGANNRSLKKRVVTASSGDRISHDAHNRVLVQALRDITLNFADGDRIGLIGRNGAGKSTLLRTVSGIYEPENGQVLVNGRVTSLFSLNLGFENEATGYENITLRGLAMGMSRTQIARCADEIAEFTELGEYLKLPVHTYSAGMRARLAFAISTAVAPDILLMDEWLSAGDKQFVKKARARINSMVQDARILVLASHNKQLLQRVCNKIVVLEAGRISAFGPADEVLEAHDDAI